MKEHTCTSITAARAMNVIALGSAYSVLAKQLDSLVRMEGHGSPMADYDGKGSVSQSESRANLVCHENRVA
jgi:hypothetical protein